MAGGGGVGGVNWAKDLSAVFLPFLLKVDPLLRMAIPTTPPPWRVRPSIVVLFCRALVSGLVIVVGFGGCLSDSGPVSDAGDVRRA